MLLLKQILLKTPVAKLPKSPYYSFFGLFKKKSNQEILDLEPNCSKSQIQSAYNYKLNELQGEAKTPQIEAQIAQYTQAYQTLMREITQKEEEQARLVKDHQQTSREPLTHKSSEQSHEHKQINSEKNDQSSITEGPKTFPQTNFQEYLEKQQQHQSDKNSTNQTTDNSSNTQEKHQSPYLELFVYSITGVVFMGWLTGSMLRDHRRDSFDDNQQIQNHPIDQYTNPNSLKKVPQTIAESQKQPKYDEKLSNQEIAPDQYADNSQYIQQLHIQRRKDQ